jgi:hypothetical protein
MRFINIVLLELCAVAGSAFASVHALPQRSDGRAHQNPITGSCLQEPQVLQVSIILESELRTFIINYYT